MNELIQNGTVQVTHSQIDIGNINDVFDNNDQTLARSASINPMIITLTFPFKVSFSGAEILQTYSDGYWTMEAADTEFDLENKTGSYEELVSMSSLIDAVPDMITFPPETKKIIRLIVRRTTGDDYVHLNEWQLIGATAEVDIVSLCAKPSEIWLLPNTSFNISLFGKDAAGLSYPILSDIEWSTTQPDLIEVEETNGKAKLISGDLKGNATLNINWNTLSEEVPVHVVEDFKPKTDITRTVKVALVIIDPPIEAAGGLRFHERFGWDDPVNLTNAVADSLDAASGGVVDYQIVSTYDESILYAALQGTFVTVDSMYNLFLEPGWTTFHQLEQTGGFAFDYNGLLAAHDFCTQSNNGEIDEVWVYSMPFTGMYESRLTGNGAFWYNSPPLSGNDCIDQLPIMGFNYERGVAEALHSFGHRVESAMVHTFGRWDYNAVEKNDWEKFASYDEAVPGNAHIGNIHFPPNGINDYDYENHSFVTTHADNWDRYPFLFDEERSINCEEWGCTHLGYMSWWYHHIPHFSCKNGDGILNNWWPYIVDYNEGKLLERETPDCPCEYVSRVSPEFLDSTFVWTEAYADWFGNEWSFKYTVAAHPTIISDKSFYEILKATSEFSKDWSGTGNYIRYENKFVYISQFQNEERILYDFNLVVGDTFEIWVNNELIVEKIDTTTLLNGEERTRWHVRCEDDVFIGYGTEWVEGIGNINGLLAHEEMCFPDVDASRILCMYKNDTLIYDDPDVDGCWRMLTSTSDPYGDHISLAPNPAQDYLIISGIDDEKFKVEIINPLGNVIYRGDESTIEISNVPAGFYFAKIHFQDKSVCTKKFIKN